MNTYISPLMCRLVFHCAQFLYLSKTVKPRESETICNHIEQEKSKRNKLDSCKHLLIINSSDENAFVAELSRPKKLHKVQEHPKLNARNLES